MSATVWRIYGYVLVILLWFGLGRASAHEAATVDVILAAAIVLAVFTWSVVYANEAIFSQEEAERE